MIGKNEQQPPVDLLEQLPENERMALLRFVGYLNDVRLEANKIIFYESDVLKMLLALKSDMGMVLKQLKILQSGIDEGRITNQHIDAAKRKIDIGNFSDEE